MCACAIASYARVWKEMVLSGSEDMEDNQIFIEASQQFKVEFAEQYVKDRRKYEHMDEDDFRIDKLMPQTSQYEHMETVDCWLLMVVLIMQNYICLIYSTIGTGTSTV